MGRRETSRRGLEDYVLEKESFHSVWRKKGCGFGTQPWLMSYWVKCQMDWLWLAFLNSRLR